MNNPSKPPVPSLAARAQAMRQKNARFARRIGMAANMKGQSGDFVQVLVMPEQMLLEYAGIPSPSVPVARDLRRDPIDLTDLTDPTTRPMLGVPPANTSPDSES